MENAGALHDQMSEQTNTASSGATSTSRSLLAGVRRLDSGSWNRLVGLYGPFVHAICRRRLGNAEDALDVYQQVFKAVAENIDGFRKTRPSDTFRGWLVAVTRNKIRDHYRRGARRPRLTHGSTAHRRIEQTPAPTIDDTDDVDVRESEVRALVGRALAAVKPQVKEQTWQAFWRTAVDGSAPKDVADELGMSAGAVRVAKSRVLQRLRRELGDIEN